MRARPMFRNPLFRTKLEGKIEELLPIMSAGELVSLLTAFGSNPGHNRNVDLLRKVSELLIM